MSAIAVNTWVDFVGFFKGIGSDNASVSTNNDSPKNMSSGTTFIRPALVMNYPAGTGTSEIDYLKIERLVSPDDSDNTLKRRICPDEEFERSTGGEYWYKSVTGSCTAVISLTGGAIGGKAVLTGDGNPANVASHLQPTTAWASDHGAAVVHGELPMAQDGKRRSKFVLRLRRASIGLRP
jgi:hypothetical protein